MNPELDQVRQQRAEDYAKGLTELALQPSPEVVAAPQEHYFARMSTVRTERGDKSVTFFHMDDCVKVMREKGIVQPGNGLLMGSPRPLIPLDLDGPEHTRYRRLLDPIFAPRNVASLEARIRSLANELIDQFCDAGTVELYGAFCVPLPTMIFTALLGLGDEDRLKFLRWKDGTLRPNGSTPEEKLANLRAAGEEMASYITEVIAQRERDGGGSDLISQLLEAEVGGERLNRQQVTDIVYLLLIAGLDTVTSSLSLMFARLAQHPELQKRLVDDPSITKSAVEELMRYEAPVARSGRLATKDLVIGDVEVKAGTYVSALWQACNVDPDVFSEPLLIDFDRPAIKHTSFATGAHRCLGSHLARLEMVCALEEFHRRIPSYEMVPGKPIEFSYEGVRAAHRLPLHIGTTR
jgi:cytochrome P450